MAQIVLKKNSLLRGELINISDDIDVSDYTYNIKNNIIHVYKNNNILSHTNSKSYLTINNEKYLSKYLLKKEIFSLSNLLSNEYIYENKVIKIESNPDDNPSTFRYARYNVYVDNERFHIREKKYYNFLSTTVVDIEFPSDSKNIDKVVSCLAFLWFYREKSRISW